MQVIMTTGGTLFAVAAAYLGDATQWVRIAALNSVDDPWLSGVVTLRLPDRNAAPGDNIGAG